MAPQSLGLKTQAKPMKSLFCFSVLAKSHQEKSRSNDVTVDLDQKIKKLAKFNEEELLEQEEQLENDPHKGTGNLSCYSCSRPNCDNPHVCHNAEKCYVAHVRDTDGVVEKSKGCVKNRDHVTFICSIRSHDGEEVHKKTNQSAQYAFECCRGKMCNEHIDFPELPSVPELGKFNSIF